MVGEVRPLRSPFKRSSNSRDSGLTAPSYQYSDHCSIHFEDRPATGLGPRPWLSVTRVLEMGRCDPKQDSVWPRLSLNCAAVWSSSYPVLLPSLSPFIVDLKAPPTFILLHHLLAVIAFYFYFLTKNCLLCTFDSFLVSTSQKLQTNTMH